MFRLFTPALTILILASLAAACADTATQTQSGTHNKSEAKNGVRMARG